MEHIPCKHASIEKGVVITAKYISENTHTQNKLTNKKLLAAFKKDISQ